MFSIYGLRGGSENPVEESVVFGCVVGGGGWDWGWHWDCYVLAYCNYMSDGDGDPYRFHGVLCPVPGRRFCSVSRGEQSPHSEEEERKQRGKIDIVRYYCARCRGR